MSKDHLDYLDGWRGLAILAVLVGHFTPIPGINLGPFGVELFFVLSGRLMAEMLIVRQTPFPTFFLRRFSRIYPALLVFCTAMLIASLFAGMAGIRLPTPVGFAEFFAALLFAMNYAAALFGMQGVLDHIWSLSVEEHSYALLALISLLMIRERTAAALTAICMALLMMSSGVLQALFTNQTEHELYWRTDIRAASVFLSFGLYLMINPRAGKASRFASVIAPLAVALATAANLDALPLWLKYSVGTTLLAVAINTVDWMSKPLRGALSGKAIIFIGALSYSLYLWQQPFYRIVAFVGWAPALAATFVAALGSYFVVERPARRFLNEMWAKRAISKIRSDGSNSVEAA
ncbi:acyltransferase (plasmid) [Rhizobium sp. WL3]|uniref:acyltransferase family protein n=1 Tax=Rhizobium sp. WL3 TaxID=2603277 RepID=UPI0011C1F19F|nr:acyltransferase [Rhizobium sp. WL3]QEE43392.1 acyltransferase [Rhizobium sp. WL3]